MFSPETEELTFLSGSKYFFKWLDLITMIMVSLESLEIFFYLPLVHLEIYNGSWMEMKGECQEKVFANEDLAKTVYPIPKLIEFILYGNNQLHLNNLSFTFYEKILEQN